VLNFTELRTAKANKLWRLCMQLVLRLRFGSVRDAEVHDRHGRSYFDSGRREAVYDASMRGIAEDITFKQALMETPRVQAAIGTQALGARSTPPSMWGSRRKSLRASSPMRAHPAG